MKKVLLLVSSLVVGAWASYFEITQERLNPEANYIFAKQRITDLVGDNLNVTKISYGAIVNTNSKTEPLEGSRYGGYLTLSNSVDTDISFGLDFTVTNTNWQFFWGLSPYFGGNVGIGWRDDKGKEVTTSTQLNTVNYIISSDLTPYLKPDTATITESTSWIELGFSLGLQRNIGKGNAKIKLGYLFQKRDYDLSYRLQSSPSILNNLNAEQRYNGFEISVMYPF